MIIRISFRDFSELILSIQTSATIPKESVVGIGAGKKDVPIYLSYQFRQENRMEESDSAD